MNTASIRKWWRADTGSASGELTLLAPLLIALMVFVAVVVHRGVNARLRLDDVAHQAARAASLERTPRSAAHSARSTADVALAAAGVTCETMTVTTDTASLNPGGTVTVEVTCRTDLADALLLGVPGTKTVTASASEPIDIWRGA